jgi:hypothetical protein
MLSGLAKLIIIMPRWQHVPISDRPVLCNHIPPCNAQLRSPMPSPNHDAFLSVASRFPTPNPIDRAHGARRYGPELRDDGIQIFRRRDIIHEIQ